MQWPIGRFSERFLTYLLVNMMLAAGTAAQHPSPAAPAMAAADVDPSQLLIKSYLSGMNLPPNQRTYQLTLLAYAAVEVDPSLARLWSQEAFQSTFTLRMNWDRVAHQKNALAALALVDANLAFAILDSMDLTVPFPSGDIPEDLRAYAARTIFREYWKRNRAAAVEPVRRQAIRLGQTGQYPFLAVVPIIRAMGSEDNASALVIIGEALVYYEKGSRTASTDDEFSKFLAEFWNFATPQLRQQALRALVTRLEKELKLPSSKVFLSRTTSEKGTVEFRSPAHKLLFSLLPRIREVDPQWAEQLLEADPVLRQASADSGKVLSSEQVMITNAAGLSSANISALQAASFERQKLRRIASLARTDPVQALELVDSLKDKVLRAQALAFIAAGLSSQDPARARSLIQEVKDGLDSIDPAASRLAVLAALAKAAAANHDQELLSQTLRRGYDLGEEVFSEDLEIHPGKAVEEVAGIDNLSGLTAVGVESDLANTIGRIDRISNDLLRSHLLMIAAENLFRARHPASPPPMIP